MEAENLKTVPEDKPVEESMESDEMLSGSDSAENTDSSDKAASGEEKSEPSPMPSEPSPMPSEPTSGIEVTSRSTSASETQCEQTEENPEYSQMPMEQESSTGVEQSSLTQEPSTSDVAPKDPELAAMPENKLKADVESLVTMASAITIKETEKSSIVQSEQTSVEEKPMVDTLASETPCEAKETDAAEDTENKAGIQTAEKSTPPKKSLFGNIKRLFSPPKSGKSKSRSKSMSPSDKAQQPAASGTSHPEETGDLSEEEDHLKKSSEKSGVIKSIKRSLSKIMVRSKSSTADSTILVSDEEIDKIEEAPKQSEKKAETSDTGKCPSNKPVWMENRLSLTERPSWDGTTMTDIPSTTWSGGDVFPNDSRRPSEVGENTSEEAVAGSLASSPDEQIPDIKEDAGSEENMKNDGASNAVESQNITAADSDSEKQYLSEETKSKDCNQHES